MSNIIRRRHCCTTFFVILMTDLLRFVFSQCSEFRLLLGLTSICLDISQTDAWGHSKVHLCSQVRLTLCCATPVSNGCEISDTSDVYIYTVSRQVCCTPTKRTIFTQGHWRILIGYSTQRCGEHSYKKIKRPVQNLLLTRNILIAGERCTLPGNAGKSLCRGQSLFTVWQIKICREVLCRAQHVRTPFLLASSKSSCAQSRLEELGITGK